MNLARILDIIAGITTVALVTVVVSSPQTAAIIRAVGESYSASLRAAMGR